MSDGVISVIGNGNLAAGPIINRTAKARLEKKLEFWDDQKRTILGSHDSPP